MMRIVVPKKRIYDINEKKIRRISFEPCSGVISEVSRRSEHGSEIVGDVAEIVPSYSEPRKGWWKTEKFAN